MEETNEMWEKDYKGKGGGLGREGAGGYKSILKTTYRGTNKATEEE